MDVRMLSRKTKCSLAKHSTAQCRLAPCSVAQCRGTQSSRFLLEQEHRKTFCDTQCLVVCSHCQNKQHHPQTATTLPPLHSISAAELTGERTSILLMRYIESVDSASHSPMWLDDISCRPGSFCNSAVMRLPALRGSSQMPCCCAWALAPSSEAISR